MPNVKCVISGHNKSIINKKLNTMTDQTGDQCNCRNKDVCPLQNKCLTTNVVYRATVTRKATYVVHTAGEFRTRYNGHTSSFRNSKYKHAMELSKFVWHLKDKNIKYSIKWRILAKCNSYSNKTRRCQLCSHEKFLIICHPNLASLNSRDELLSKCRHAQQIPLEQ